MSYVGHTGHRGSRGRGKFIVFEGQDCSGKSTAIRNLHNNLYQQCQAVHMTREPGGTPTAEAIRALVLDPTYEMDQDTEMLLFFAARCHHSKHIMSLLDQGITVLCDRYVDSSLAYQSRNIHELKKNLLWASSLPWLITPDVTLFFRASIDTCMRRMSIRKADGKVIPLDRIENSIATRIKTIYKNYEYLSTSPQRRYTVIDAEQSIDKVHAAVAVIIDEQVNRETA